MPTPLAPYICRSCRAVFCVPRGEGACPWCSRSAELVRTVTVQGITKGLEAADGWLMLGLADGCPICGKNHPLLNQPDLGCPDELALCED